jgi:hypothetical protein
MARLIEIRKLAAVDMVWLGTRIIVAEYACGVVLPLALGVLTLHHAWSDGQPFSLQRLLGWWLIGISANYVPLLLYAVSIARSGSVETEGAPELARASRYGVQQSMILVPLLVVVVALFQEHRKR